MFKIENTKIKIIQFSFKENVLAQKVKKYSLTPNVSGTIRNIDKNSYYTELSVDVKDEEKIHFHLIYH